MSYVKIRIPELQRDTFKRSGSFILSYYSSFWRRINMAAAGRMTRVQQKCKKNERGVPTLRIEHD